MKFISILSILALLLFSCNSAVETTIEPQSELTPDYNLLAEGESLYIHFDKTKNLYGGKGAIYLRPFENVGQSSEVILQFSSTQNGRFIIANDTLYNNDKKRIKYSDFKRFLIDFRYETEVPGTHQITIKSGIKTVSKTSNITFNTFNN